MNVKTLKKHLFITNFDIEINTKGDTRITLYIFNLKAQSPEKRFFKLSYSELDSMSVSTILDTSERGVGDIYNFKKYIRHFQNSADALFQLIACWNRYRKYLWEETIKADLRRHTNGIEEAFRQISRKYGIQASYVTDNLNGYPVYSSEAFSASYTSGNGVVCVEVNDSVLPVSTDLIRNVPLDIDNPLWSASIIRSLQKAEERGQKFAETVYENNYNFIKQIIEENEPELAGTLKKAELEHHSSSVELRFWG